MLYCFKAFIGFVVIAAAIGTDRPQSPDSDKLPNAKRVDAVVIDLTQQREQVLETKTKRRINTVDGFDSEVLKLKSVKDPTKILLSGIQKGVTRLWIIDEEGTREDLIVVVIDTAKR